MLGKNEWVDMHAFQEEMGLDKSTTLELYEIFVQELTEETDKLEAATAITDHAMSSRIVHNIKGITASYKAGASLLQAVHFDLLCKGEQWEAFDQKLSDFLQILRQTIEGIHDLLRKEG